MSYQASSVPEHVAIIMDGNRRWARKHGLKIIEGHRKVARELLERLADHCIARNISFLTVWAFSTENWNREQEEVQLLLNLFRELLGENIEKLHRKGIKLNTIGDTSKFPEDIHQELLRGIKKTQENFKLTLTIALNYGGRDEIIRTVREISEEIKTGKIQPTDIDEQLISNHLDTASLPDPDLIIRPGGEKRLSGYLPWQGTYAELYFSDVLMPDFDETQFDQALKEYAQRQRRFGQ